MRGRGNIKWTAMMMPEHVEMLRDYFNEENYKEKPILDEQQAEEINSKLQYALSNNTMVEITYYADHDYHIVKGRLQKADPFTKTIKLDNEDETKIALGDVLGVWEV